MGKWTKDSVHGKYTVYKKRDGKKYIYNVTTTGRVPSAGTGGYASKTALLKLKNIK